MLILQNDCNNQKNSINSIVAIFGVGLIGVNLVQALFKHSYKIIQILPFAWDEGARRANENEAILNCIDSLLATPINSPTRAPYIQSRIDFVWSAGKGGFGMPGNDTLQELASFNNVLDLAVSAVKGHPSCMVRFHMLSSAGGLFEGQRNVGRNTKPCVKRPYAEMKLKQEQLLGSCCDIIPYIYRPTSVYGFAGLHRRMGLIPTLLWNGYSNKVSSIYGTPDTIRDYVWSNDVGSFIANKISLKATVAETHILASGKPSSIFEIHRRIEKLLNKKLFCHYIKEGGNTEHNTFNTATYPAGWNPLNIETGISKTYRVMFSNIGY